MTLAELKEKLNKMPKKYDDVEMSIMTVTIFTKEDKNTDWNIRFTIKEKNLPLENFFEDAKNGN